MGSVNACHSLTLGSCTAKEEHYVENDVVNDSQARINVLQKMISYNQQQKSSFATNRIKQLTKCLLSPDSAQTLCTLASAYDTTGESLSKDTQKACLLYRRAIQDGSIDALNLLAIHYELDPTFTNMQEIFDLYQEASNHNHLEATLLLAHHYRVGKKITRDFKKAFDLYTKAAGLNDPDPCAFFYLAICYERGEGVDQDMKKARELYQKSADCGFTPAIERLAKLG